MRKCVASTFRSSGGGAARKRRRWPAPHQSPAATFRQCRTSVRLTRSVPVHLCSRMHQGPISHHGAEQRSTPVGCSTSPLRQRRREGAWWDGPGPALARGRSLDGLKTDTVDLRGGQGDVRRGARSSACLPCAPFGEVCPPWRGIQAGWHPRVGLRTDPPARDGLRAALDR